MARLVLDVGGSRFVVRKDTLERGPASRLTRLYEESAARGDRYEGDPVEVDRPAENFAAILALYQTGELHMPSSSCPGAFLTELEYWNVSPDLLATCCQIRLQTFHSDQGVIEGFQNSLEVNGQANQDDDSQSRIGSSCFWRGRRRVWDVVDNREKSLLAKLYLFLVTLMVVLSIVALGISTEPEFQRLMNNCERLDYMETAKMDNIDIAAKLLGGRSSCERNKTIIDKHLLQSPFYIQEDAAENDYVYYPWDVPEDGKAANSTLLRSIFLYVKIPNMRVPKYWFVVVETVTLVFFTIDLVLRLTTCPSLLTYFRSVINVGDAAALIGTYLHLVVVSLDTTEKYRLTMLDLLAYLQVLRSLRLVRVVRNFKMYKILAYTLYQNVRDLLILALILIICMCIFGSTVFVAEKRKNSFVSIPRSWYWALITMTTVGYGDMYPMTLAGRILASLCAVTGLILFAMTVPIFVNNFLTLYQFATSNIKGYRDRGTADESYNSQTIKYKEMSKVTEKNKVVLET